MYHILHCLVIFNLFRNAFVHQRVSFLDKYTPDEWIQALANDDDFHRRVEEDPVFREQIEKELAEMEAENALEDLREEL